MTTITNKQRRENLIKLAEYLEKLPVDYKHFDMTPYFALDPLMSKAEAIEAFEKGPSSCGTVACALGHGIAAGVKPIREMVDPYTAWGFWHDYASQFVETLDGDDWPWLFSDAWSEADNSHRGAAARIRYYLDHGVPSAFAERDYPSDDFDPEWADIYASYIKVD